MYIRKTVKHHKGRTYLNHLLVESVHSPQGPRQRIICSLGSLAPAPREAWGRLARKLDAALAGQLPLAGTEAPRAPRLAEQLHAPRRRRGTPRPGEPSDRVLAVDTERVAIEEAREAGPIPGGHHVWRQVDLEAILGRAGLAARACRLTEAMTLNRLIYPLSEHAMPDWMRRTALADLLGVDFATRADDALFRNLDRLPPRRAQIEKELAEREKTLFKLDDTLSLYDVTSTYFDGQAQANPQAKRGYSRDKRPDCKQVLVGLVLDREGFPKAHEVFEGNRQDRSTLAAIVDSLEQRTGKQPGTTVVMDRGMAYPDNLAELQGRHLHYMVAGRPPERAAGGAELERADDGEEGTRPPSPRNPAQQKSRVQIKRRTQGAEVVILCRSAGREAKDRAIRETHANRLRADLEALRTRIAAGRLKAAPKIQAAIGRLQERYPRVARYSRIAYDEAARQLTWPEDPAKQGLAETLDGSYLLRTDRQDLTADEIWRTYILLTRVEAAFRAMKSPLLERPIFHQLAHRTQAHIFLCVLAYHLLVAIEKRCLDRGVHTSWWTLRQQLSTHQVVTVILPTATGRILKIRKATTPEPQGSVKVKPGVFGTK